MLHIILYYLIRLLKFHGSGATPEGTQKILENISSSSMIYFDYLLQLHDKVELEKLQGYGLHSYCFIY